jgi:hypothetical protein
VRGSPLLRALAAFIIIAALGWPLAKLTHRGAAAPIAALPAQGHEKAVTVALSFTHLPRRVAIWHLGEEKWSADVKESQIETTLTLPWPSEGVDLRFVVDWQDTGSLAGAQVRITDPEGTEHLGSIFSKGPADEILTFR